MRPLNIFLAAMAIGATCNRVSARAPADNGGGVGSIAQVVIVDRRNGVELISHFYRGEYWVAGTPGVAYSISIRNRLGERLLAVTSVDGVNVISGATASWDQSGYVFDANQRYDITGWRKSDSEVAAFTFTASPNSYAERTGHPANVGVIGVALYRERQPVPTPVYSPPIEPAPAAAPLPKPDEAPPARAAAAPSAAASRSLDARAPKLGTGHGEREYSYVNHAEFARLQPEPNEIIRIRYDSYDNLVAMGVIERSRPALPSINPFPGSPVQEYVPDPPGTNAGGR